MQRIFIALALATSVVAEIAPVRGIHCSKNQIVRKLTVFEDGALEAECGPVPCGEVGRRCIDDQTSCRAETDVFSGMRWAPNGESVLLRCCTMKTSNKIYVGTDVVSTGSFYEGGAVAEKDLYSTGGGSEYDFIANARAEQGGVRVWVYRVICKKGEKPVDFFPITTPLPLPPLVATTTSVSTTTTEAAEEVEETENTQVDEDGEEEFEEDSKTEQDEEEEEEETTTQEHVPFNPLRYRPAKYSATRRQ